MLKGYDTSHWNDDMTFDKYLENGDFMILKATEGKTYKDPKFEERSRYTIAKHLNTMLYGFYHYARPENNAPQEEVNNFYNAIKDYLTDRCIIALDWEGKALEHSFDWALEFCKEIEKLTKRKCLIYASASVVKKYASQYAYWWTAHYNNSCENGCNHDGVEEVMIQFTSTPIDTNIFKGTEKEWRKLAGQATLEHEEVLYEWQEGNSIYKLTRRSV